jgi:hypothetical protein
MFQVSGSTNIISHTPRKLVQMAEKTENSELLPDGKFKVDAVRLTEAKKQKVFRCGSGNGGRIVMRCRSLSEFSKETGCRQNFSAETHNPEEIQAALNAPAGCYAISNHYHHSGSSPWKHRQGRISGPKITLDPVIQRGSGIEGYPLVSLADGEPEKVNHLTSRNPKNILVNGELRGSWIYNLGDFVLRDATKTKVRPQSSSNGSRTVIVNVHNEVRIEVNNGHQVKLSPWNDTIALAMSIMAIEDGVLPTIPEQEKRLSDQIAAAEARQHELEEAKEIAGVSVEIMSLLMEAISDAETGKFPEEWIRKARVLVRKIRPDLELHGDEKTPADGSKFG